MSFGNFPNVKYLRQNSKADRGSVNHALISEAGQDVVPANFEVALPLSLSL